MRKERKTFEREKRGGRKERQRKGRREVEEKKDSVRPPPQSATPPH